jgi:hypothetical protein
MFLSFIKDTLLLALQKFITMADMKRLEASPPQNQIDLIYFKNWLKFLSVGQNLK